MGSLQISVIIPVYNAQLFLKKSVESALNFAEVDEIILVEDGSTDNSLVLCRELSRKHGKVRLIRHPGRKNKGAGASRNLGIKAAKNSWIAFLDADDFYLPNRFCKDEEIIKKTPWVDGVYNCLGSKFYTDDELVLNNFLNRTITTVRKKYSPEELFENLSPIGRGGHFHLDTLTVRKDLLMQVGLFNERLRVTQDTHLIYRLALLGQLVPGNIKNPVAVRGIHENNRSTKSNIQSYQLEMFKSLFEWGINQKITKSKKEILWSQFYTQYVRELKNEGKSKRKFKIIQFLAQIGLRNPKIFFYRTFWKLFF